jgi:hypothetical protein
MGDWLSCRALGEADEIRERSTTAREDTRQTGDAKSSIHVPSHNYHCTAQTVPPFSMEGVLQNEFVNIRMNRQSSTVVVWSGACNKPCIRARITVTLLTGIYDRRQAVL